jgi:hypothetical protein
VDVSPRAVVDVGTSDDGETGSLCPASADDALKLAIKLAVDKGDFERATLLIAVARRAGWDAGRREDR